MYIVSEKKMFKRKGNEVWFMGWKRVKLRGILKDKFKFKSRSFKFLRFLTLFWGSNRLSFKPRSSPTLNFPQIPNNFVISQKFLPRSFNLSLKLPSSTKHQTKPQQHPKKDILHTKKIKICKVAFLHCSSHSEIFLNELESSEIVHQDATKHWSGLHSWIKERCAEEKFKDWENFQLWKLSSFLKKEGEIFCNQIVKFLRNVWEREGRN